MKSRVTQRDIARKAKVSYVTVSHALRGHRSVSEKTRTRIAAIAEKLGYVPDPFLTGLAAYRASKRPPAYHANIAMVTAMPLNRENPGNPLVREYFAGAEGRCRELGYGLEEICLEELEFNGRRLETILKAKGIQGLLLAPGYGIDNDLTLDWSKFSAIRFGYSYRHPKLHTVTNAQFHTALTAAQKAMLAGHQRVGILLDRSLHERTAWHLLGGFRAAQDGWPKKCRIEPFHYDHRQPAKQMDAALRKWVRHNKPGCIIGGNAYTLLLRNGWRVPEDISYIDVDCWHSQQDISGISQHHQHVAATAITFLIGMMHRGETGIPEMPTHFYIEGVWNEGTTLRPLGAPTSANSYAKFDSA